MMRGKKSMVTAVRRPDGQIVTRVQALPSLYTGWSRRAPFLRGIIVLIESLVLGMQSLTYSANVSLEEEEEELTGKSMWLVTAVGIALGVAVFFLLPLYITRLFHIQSSIWFNLVDGLIRLVIFIIYLKAVSSIKTIKRVFAYHGAEHKTVNAYESDVPLTVESVRQFSTAHVRCGTSFLFIVMVIAIIAFALVGKPAWWLMVFSRIVLIPVIASVSYEVTYFAGRHAKNPVVKILLAPGLWLQSFTTRQPDDSMLEVAITALKQVIAIDEGSNNFNISPIDAVTSANPNGQSCGSPD